LYIGNEKISPHWRRHYTLSLIYKTIVSPK
jgi:hypothetical protein